MAKTSENYRGVHKKYNVIMEELCIVLNPDYEENDDYYERLIDCHEKVSEMKNELQSAVKNIKTPKTQKRYNEELNSIEFWQNEISTRLKNDF